MITFIIYRLLSLAYLGIMILVILNAISFLTFSKRKDKVAEFFKRLFLAPVWPIAALSKEGRDRLFKFTRKF